MIKLTPVALAFLISVAQAEAQAPRFNVSVPATTHASPITGRLIVILAKTAQPEPRLTVSPQGPAIFAVDLEAWEAIYGPMDADGYPRPLWNKLTGTIDHEVAAYMRDHGYDLREFAQRNWTTLGPQLAGKLHFFAGDMDDFFLNLAVYRWEEFLKTTTNPHSDAEFTFGRPTKGHGWHAFPWAEFVRRMGAHVKKNSPAGEDVARWNY